MRKHFKRDHVTGTYSVTNVHNNDQGIISSTTQTTASPAPVQVISNDSNSHPDAHIPLQGMEKVWSHQYDPEIDKPSLFCSEILDFSTDSSCSDSSTLSIDTFNESPVSGRPLSDPVRTYSFTFTQRGSTEQPLSASNPDSRDHDNATFDIGNVNWSSQREATIAVTGYLSNQGEMSKLCELLYSENLLRDFVSMIAMFISGKLSVNNIPFLCCMDRVRFESLTSSTLMRFNDFTKRFWATIMRIGRGRVLDVLSGHKSAGNVINNKEKKGIYKPENADVNFVIPSKDILTNHQSIIRKSIKPGIIQETFDMLDTSKQHILMFDGKKISPGLGEYPVGDVNLLGLEGPPSIPEKMQKHNSNLKICDELNELLQEDEANGDDSNKKLTVPLIESLIQSFASEIRQVHSVIARSQRQINKLKSYVDVRMPQRYDFAISNEEGRIYIGQQWLENVSESIKELLYILSCLHSSYMYTRDLAVVDLTGSGNYLPLHSVESIMRNPRIQLRPSIIKQRSHTWYEMRGNAVISGSSAWSGLGLRGIAALRKHFKEYIVKGKSKTKVSPVETDRMEYGNANEINAVGTCITSFMPAFLPPCYTYKEQGSYFIHGKKRSDPLCVSPDGLLVCKFNDDKGSKKLSHARHCPIVVEIKCPYPENGCIPLHYTIPNYYVLQVLLEMHATSTSKCWFISYSKDWCTLIQVCKDDNLVETVLKAIEDVYDKNDVIFDKSIISKNSFLKPLINRFVESNTSLISISPSVTVSNFECTCTSVDVPYHKFNNVETDNNTEIHIPLLGAVMTIQQLLKEGFQILREKGQELITGIITDANRVYNPDIPSNMPVVYGLKSHSLPVAVMRKFVEKTRDACHNKGVKIICEAYDGQWCQLVFKDAQNRPLTRFQLQRECWNESKKMGKKKLLDYFKSLSVVTKDDLLFWTSTAFLSTGTLSSGNLEVVKCNAEDNESPVLFLSTPGWDEDNLNDVEIIQSPRKFMFEHSAAYHYKSTAGSKKSHTEEMDINDIIQYLPQYVWDDGQEDDFDKSRGSLLDLSRLSVRSSFSVDEDQEIDNYPDLLKHILVELRKSKHGHKYADMNERQLYFSVLGSTETIGKEMTVIELNAVNAAIHQVTHRNAFNKSDLKVIKVNKLGKLFRDTEKWFATSSKKKSPKSLKCTVEQYMASASYPKIILTCAHASIQYSKKELTWEHSSPLPMELRLEGQSRPFDMFCFPERSEKRSQLEPRIIDPSHILNNVRAKICRSGIDAFDKATVSKLAACQDKQIQSLMINKLLDQQNTELSMRFFSPHVQEILEQLGCDKSAEFVRIFREWFMACDTRGIDPVQRVKMLMAMHHYLLDDYEFHMYPPPGRYYKGIPVQTVEAILHNISMRMLLYLISEDGTVNHRALATLGVESFYSLIAFMDYSGLHCPKATQLEYLLSHVINLNHTISDPDRNFDMQGKKRSKYPADVLLSQLDVQRENDDDIFRTNLFDIPKPGDKSQRIKVAKNHNSIFGQEVGYQGVRRYYKTDTSRFTIFDKLGIDAHSTSGGN